VAADSNCNLYHCSAYTSGSIDISRTQNVTEGYDLINAHHYQ